MHIQIRYFALLREIVGDEQQQLVVPDEATIADVRAILLARYTQLLPILERCVYAVNRCYVPTETALKEGDELVFIPPTGGGAAIDPIIQLTYEPLDRDALIAAINHPSVGGIVVFEGVVRNNTRGKQVCHLEYEVYEEMAVEQIRVIIATAQQRWGIERIAVAHRFGRLEIGEASVIIVVASPHRNEAFDACRYIIDILKRTVPIWKKEVTADGEVWVEG